MSKITRIDKKKPELSKQDIIKANPWKKSSEDLLINKGQVNIHFDSVSSVSGGLLVGFFVSNGLSRKVKFEKVPLILVDSDKRVVARQSFDGEIIGELASGSAKACVARFLPENVHVQDVPENCKLSLDLPAKKTIKIQYQELPEHFTEGEKRELERILAKLPPMKHGRVGFSPLHAKISENNDFFATVIVRNSSNKKIKLGQVPLIIFDTDHKELARGQFDIKGLTIDPFKAILLPLNFGPVSLDPDIDLSRSSWSVKVITEKSKEPEDGKLL